ncbi:MAG: coiled-coil domain-containing protein [Collinsella sp.]
MQHSNHRTAALIASKPARIITSAALAVALTATPMLSPVAAYAASQATQDQLSAAQQKIEAATSAYNDARTKLDDLQKQIDSNEASIEEIEASSRAAGQGKLRHARSVQVSEGHQPIVSFLVNAQSLGEFITTCKYTNQITSSSVDEIEQLNNMQTELEQNKAELQQAKSQLEAEQKNAEDALAQAQQLRSEAQAKAEQENAAELAKLEADKAAAAEKLSGEGVSGSNSSSQATNTNTTIDTTVNSSNTGSSDYDSFINEWTGRIDNYLAGSPMAGQGYNFAVAAWNTGVDPRWSPAIACIESTKGAYCANSYNAWGWSARGGGWRSFGSWSEGISAHVAYLGANYGSTLTPAAAKSTARPRGRTGTTKSPLK